MIFSKVETREMLDSWGCGSDGWVYVRVFFLFSFFFFGIRVWEDGTVWCLRRGKEKIEKKKHMVQNPPIIKDGVKEGGKEVGALT